MSHIRRLLERAQPGSRGGVERHIRRGEQLRTLIESRYGVTHPRQWRAKHLRWALEHGLADLAPGTRYHYWRTARACAAALGEWPDWEPHLRGSWTRPDGGKSVSRIGRSPKMAYRASSD
ncbi:hypothetical protein [Methylohalobius crimeensis]|uniref:hypothetical protein n=1 Tax=Methylohalobius crimeensis TaxID=244365 RepID=UPI0003B5B314|nr:hypothetical protein [Methylohalobius crimeensis]